MKHIGVKTLKCKTCGYCIEHNIYEDDFSLVARCKKPACMGSQVIVKQHRSPAEVKELLANFSKK